MPDENMGCGCGCQDCECKEVEICDTTEHIDANLRDKLMVFKDYVCTIALTPCSQLGKVMSKVIYYLWCMLKDLVNMVINNRKRTETLMENDEYFCGRVGELEGVVKYLEDSVKYLNDMVSCLDNRNSKIVDYLLDKIKENVAFNLLSKGTQSGPVATTVETSKDGSFKISWTMADGGGAVGKGTVNGKVNHKYSVNKDGSIHVVVENVTITDVVYTAYRGGSSSAKFVVKDDDGAVVFSKTYNPYASWRDTADKVITYNSTLDIQPKTGSDGNLRILSTEDTWIGNPTFGNITLQYTNNNEPIPGIDDLTTACIDPNSQDAIADGSGVELPKDCEIKHFEC